jgi:hypothetical protein
MRRHDISISARLRQAGGTASRGHDSCTGRPSTENPRPGGETIPDSRDAVSEVLAADAVYCPECGMPAWVEWSEAAASTSGAVDLAKVRCFARHWFLMPADHLPR